MSATTLPLAAARSPAQLALRRFLHRPAAVIGLFVITLFVVLAVFAPFIAPADPIKTSWSLIRKAPGWAHWMGTDENGRDVLSRVIFGARASMLAGVVSVLIAAGVGVPVGLLAGFAGGKIDAVLSRVVDAMLACPFLILAIALAAFLGPALHNAMIAIGVSAAPIFMRVARGATLDAATHDYVEAARATGNPPWRVAVRHILPNIVPPVLVQATLAIATAIIAEASLVVPRPWPAAPGAVLGVHAERRAAFFDPGAVARDFSGAGDFPVCAVVQSRWGRSARRTRPAATVTHALWHEICAKRPREPWPAGRPCLRGSHGAKNQQRGRFMRRRDFRTGPTAQGAKLPRFAPQANLWRREVSGIVKALFPVVWDVKKG